MASAIPPFDHDKRPDPFLPQPSNEAYLSSPSTAARREPGPTMSYEPELPDPARHRMSADDARRDDYWHGYYDRKRREREREREYDYFADHQPHQQRYIEYPEDSHVHRSTSVRGSRPPPPLPPTARYRGSRRMSSSQEAPLKRSHQQYDFDDEAYAEEEYGMRGNRRGPPTEYEKARRASWDSREMRIPYTRWMSKTLKGHFVAGMGEFVGTTMFLFFAFAGTQVANVGGQNSQLTTTNQETGFSPQVLLYIALCFGFSLMVNVWVFFRISGGLFNPAVTLAMAMTGAITIFRAVLLVTTQIAGSIFASFLVSVMFPSEFKVRTTLSPETSLVRGVFIEAVLTFELVFTIFLLAKEKHKATFMAPVGIGLALFIAELVGVYYTGGSLNPARSFGPCVVTGVFDREHWIYWVGPGAGAIAAVIFYKFIKILEYEMANPGQDGASEHEAKTATVNAKPENFV